MPAIKVIENCNKARRLLYTALAVVSLWGITALIHAIRWW